MHFSFTYDNLNRLSIVNVAKETENTLYELTYQNSNPNPNALIINGVSKEILYEGKRIVKFGTSEYKYNSQGIRTYKLYKEYDANGVQINQREYYYILEGNRIIKEVLLNGYELDFNYDINGELVGFNYNGVTYFYIKNMLGIIEKIIDENGNLMVSYTYDSWGKLLTKVASGVGASSVILEINPFIYKSYYYDYENEVYYLNSRYYHPSLRRFLTIDDIDYLDVEALGNLNLYAYCNNNPVMYSDGSGHDSESIWKIIGGVGILFSLGLLTIATAGATTGFLVAVAPIISGAFYGALSGAAIGVISGAIESKYNGKDLFTSIADSAFEGVLTGMVSGAISGGFSKIQFSTIGKAYPGFFKGANVLIQGGIQGSLSMMDSCLSGGTKKEMTYAFLFGMIGGMIGANANAGTKTVIKDFARSSFGNVGSDVFEYLLSNF